jgi:hypothetical protein
MFSLMNVVKYHPLDARRSLLVWFHNVLYHLVIIVNATRNDHYICNCNYSTGFTSRWHYEIWLKIAWGRRPSILKPCYYSNFHTVMNTEKLNTEECWEILYQLIPCFYQKLLTRPSRIIPHASFSQIS